MHLRFWFSAHAATLAIAAALQCSAAQAQDINAGKLVYTTPQVTGKLSCSAGSCHTPNPLLNQNRILLAADNSGAIGVALNSVLQMAFLKGVMTTQQFIDLAAYIGNPTAASGAPIAQLSPSSLAFPATIVGTSSSPQTFAISNTGTAPLVVSAVASNNAAFSVVSTCATINAGASCNVSVSFTPEATAVGPQSGTITVSHNASAATSMVNVSGTVAVPTVPGIQVTPITLDFGSATAGSFTGIQPTSVTSVGTAPLIITSISDAGAAFPYAGGTCAVGVAIPVGASCTLYFRFVPSVAGAQSGVLAIRHNASAAPTTVNLRGVGLTAVPSSKLMVEYLYAPLNYYFMTSRDEDKAVLDTEVGFQRTGLTFPVYATEAAGSSAISRFFFPQIAVNGSRGSHFYTLLDNDKVALAALNPSNAQVPRLPYYEGTDSWAFLPVLSGPGGVCANDQQPVYRLFRGAAVFPDDPNHRYTASLGIYNAFVSLGWDGEGVSFCVPKL